MEDQSNYHLEDAKEYFFSGGKTHGKRLLLNQILEYAPTCKHEFRPEDAYTTYEKNASGRIINESPSLVKCKLCGKIDLTSNVMLSI